MPVCFSQKQLICTLHEGGETSELGLRMFGYSNAVLVRTELYELKFHKCVRAKPAMYLQFYK